jgi:hypothetical protein
VGYFLNAAPRLAKIALVAGAFGVTVSAAMKTLSARAKIKGLALGAEQIIQSKPVRAGIFVDSQLQNG